MNRTERWCWCWWRGHNQFHFSHRISIRIHSIKFSTLCSRCNILFMLPVYALHPRKHTTFENFWKRTNGTEPHFENAIRIHIIELRHIDFHCTKPLFLIDVDRYRLRTGTCTHSHCYEHCTNVQQRHNIWFDHHGDCYDGKHSKQFN